MVRLLGELYSRRIVNVNVNIVLAGVLALIPTVGVVHLTKYVGLESDRHDHKLIITAVTFIADVVFDVTIYYFLHWLANHWPRFRRDRPARPHLTFFRDATLVQFQRMVMSPVMYTLALGGMYTLMSHGVARELSVMLGFALGIAATRVIHTYWMLRDERVMAERLRAAGVKLEGDEGAGGGASPGAGGTVGAAPEEKKIAV